MDELLATHFAHLFIRDPIVIFSEDLKHLDLSAVDHFENLQSTNWQHMRFKPPPPSSGGNETGWRVEFRSMEIQMTDFENAAFSIFIVLVTRAILSFDLNFYVPIPRVTENMETAHSRDAVLNDRFYFRKNPFSHVSRYEDGVDSLRSRTAGNTQPDRPQESPTLGPVQDEYELMTIDEIVNGQRLEAQEKATNGANLKAEQQPFPGLIPLVESYLNSVNVDVETRCELARYLDLIRKRARGSLWTGARWIRNFVRSHAEYKQDSVVNSEITYDLCKAAEEIAKVPDDARRKSKGWQMFHPEA